MITIQFNGQAQQVSPGTTILQLLEASGVKSRFCAVERNGELVRRLDYASTPIEANDQIEVVTLVGGG